MNEANAFTGKGENEEDVKIDEKDIKIDEKEIKKEKNNNIVNTLTLLFGKEFVEKYVETDETKLNKFTEDDIKINAILLKKKLPKNFTEHILSDSIDNINSIRETILDDIINIINSDFFRKDPAKTVLVILNEIRPTECYNSAMGRMEYYSRWGMPDICDLAQARKRASNDNFNRLFSGFFKGPDESAEKPKE